MKGGAALSKGRTGTGHFLFIFLILGAKRRKLPDREEEGSEKEARWVEASC